MEERGLPMPAGREQRGECAGGMPDILQKILERKREEIAEKKARVPAAAISTQASDAPPPRPFAGHCARGWRPEETRSSRR